MEVVVIACPSRHGQYACALPAGHAGRHATEGGFTTWPVDAIGAGWSTERIADQWREEIRARFEADRAASRAEDAAGIDRARREDPARWARFIARAPHLAEPGDGAHWTAYLSSDIRIRANLVRVILPSGWMIGQDLIGMFDGVSVAWTGPLVSAEVVDGEARVVIELLLVDYWDDACAAALAAERSPVARDLDRDQLARVGVCDVSSVGQLAAGDRVRIVHGMWQGRVGTIERIQRDASGERLAHYVLVRMSDGDSLMIWDPGYLQVERDE